MAVLARIAGGETVAHYETVRVRKDGLQIFISTTGSPLKGPDGRVVGVSNIARDVTEQKRAAAELISKTAMLEAQLRLELEVAGSLLARADTVGTQRHLTSACKTAAETISMARDLMAQLRPPALDDYGLMAALRTFAETQSLRLALRIDVTGHDLSPRPIHLVEAALFRIAQEAVINAARHASASRVVIEASKLDTRVELTIADDGVGFEPDAPATGSDHWGLKNMRERARAVGGVLRVTTAPGAGTRITADVPPTGLNPTNP